MRVLVTGASGYAGFYAALRLAGAGHTVTGIVRHPDQPRLKILRSQEIVLACGDVGQPESFRAELERSDVVIHTLLDKKKPFDTDRALFKALTDLSVRSRPIRLIYTTGCSIFGKTGKDVLDELTEPNPKHPLAFRRELEKEALALKGVGTVVLRPGFMYGCDGFNSVSADWFEMAKTGDAIFRGDREKGWSWIHIADLAEAYRLVVEAEDGALDGEIFHVADEHRPRCVDVMRACMNAAGYRGEIRFEGPKQGDNISTWFDQNEFITSKKANDRLRWRARHIGIIGDIDRIYQSWKAAEGAA